MDWLREPLIIHAIMAAISIPAVRRICVRVGRSPALAWLMLLPALGPPLAITLLVRGAWPNYPDPAKPAHPRTGR